MKYRIAKCLSDLNSKYQVIQDYAILEDGSRLVIHKTESDQKFFYVKNKGPYLRDDKLRRKFGLYSDYIKNAIDDIRAGKAHALESAGDQTNVFNSGFNPVWFLDEEYGEQLRQKTIEGWKDAQFGYGVLYGSKYSFGAGKFVSQDGTTCLLSSEKPACFDTEDEAYEFMIGLVEEAKKCAKEVVDRFTIDNKAKQSEILHRMIPGRFVVQDMFWDLIEELDDHHFTVRPELESRYIHLTQMVKPKVEA